jgi:hypothetical protein
LQRSSALADAAAQSPHDAQANWDPSERTMLAVHTPSVAV